MTPPSDSIEALVETIVAGVDRTERTYGDSGPSVPVQRGVDAEKAARALANRAREAERERGVSDEAGLALARELQVAERERDEWHESLIALREALLEELDVDGERSTHVHIDAEKCIICVRLRAILAAPESE